MNRSLILFAKPPILGIVKTRLACSIGTARATQLYGLMVKASLGLLFSFRTCRKIIAVSDRVAVSYFDGLNIGRRARVVSQGGGNLGERMFRVFNRVLRKVSDRAIIIGSDSPTLPKSYVQKAFLLLKDHDLVLGPSLDGGYYLIGARHQPPHVFRGIPWSSSSVLEATIRKARKKKLSVKLLPYWYDVDELSDLKLLANHLKVMAFMERRH